MKRLSLSTQLLLLFWGPGILFLLLMVYYPLKKVTYPVKSELRIPEEHRQFMEVVRRYEERPRKEEGELKITQNPFYEEKTKAVLRGLPVERLKLSAIYNYEKRACVINGRLYREGEKIGKIKISKIGDYYVELSLPKGKRVRLEVGGIFSLSAY